MQQVHLKQRARCEDQGWTAGLRVHARGLQFFVQPVVILEERQVLKSEQQLVLVLEGHR